MKQRDKFIATIYAALVFCYCIPFSATAQAFGELELHDLEYIGPGFLQKTGGDPYIVFPELDDQYCSPSGVQFTIRFIPMPSKPFYMELLWHPVHEGFSEVRKVFFIVHPERGNETVSFFVPIEHQAGYKQIRLDLPSNLESVFRVEEYTLHPLDNIQEDANVVDSYYRLTARETENPAIFIPYVLKTIRHGISRMRHDPAFLIFWLMLIVAILFSIRASRTSSQ